ncbi:Ulp1 peptidase [Trifolium repens]|nr:Ulp1 peptidase [Trifolium repens]
MGRAKHEHLWIHVRKVENGRKWICKHCNVKFSGGASRIQTHLGLGGKGGGGIRRCSNYHANDGIHNMASTSNNSLEVLINRVYSTQDQGVNDSDCNTSVFENEINQLKQLVLDLECEENDINKQLQWLESRGKKCKPKVNVWLRKLQEMKGITVAAINLNDSHGITELIQKMKRHREENDFNIKKVLKLVEDDKVFVIGIYGMGGVGKTLLATLVENEVKRKTTFKDVFWVTVSDNTNISKLQHDIAKRIGVNLDEDDERIRADYLSSALEKKGKSILILDDVWKYIDLEKVGIHPKVNGIKVIVTTRLKHVCHQMDCQPNVMIPMFTLSCYNEDEYEYADEDEVEDWDLFMLNLGHGGTPKILPYEIDEVARCIIRRFHGLPLGIKVMARTMKGIDDIGRWEHALNKLKKLEIGQELEEEVFKVLKRSYDNLMDKDLQNCFLYCALLSDDMKYFDYELIMKLVENGLINGNRCLEEISDEVEVIFERLRAHSLDYTLRLVKDMACYILKESKRDAMLKVDVKLAKIPLTQEWGVDLEIVHFDRCPIKEIPDGMSPYCPRLSTLIINSAEISHVPENFFEYMNSLTILDLSHNRRLESLPNSITKLRYLVSLVLRGCISLKHVPPLGELQTLSRLVITESSIEEALQGLDTLLNLKWLDLSHNKSLNLDLGSLSNLTKMQYLDLRDTLVVITVEYIQGMKKLERFGGIVDIKDVQKMSDISVELIIYHLIFIDVCGESRRYSWNYNDLQEFYLDGTIIKTMQFENCENFSLTLPKDLTCLRIGKNIHLVCLCDSLSYNNTFMQRDLYKIDIISCQKLQSLFCFLSSCSFCTEFQCRLQVLILNSLESLTGFYKDVGDVRQSLSLRNILYSLQLIKIDNCNLIETLLTPPLVQQLPNLGTLIVSRCGSMKEIIAVSNNDQNESSFIALPKLTSLRLSDLPQLKTVCKRSIHCGSSQPRLSIHSCPELVRHPTVKLIDCEIPYFGIFTTDIDHQTHALGYSC